MDVTEQTDPTHSEQLTDDEVAALIARMVQGDAEAFVRLFGTPIGEPDP